MGTQSNKHFFFLIDCFHMMANNYRNYGNLAETIFIYFYFARSLIVYRCKTVTLPVLLNSLQIPAFLGMVFVCLHIFFSDQRTNVGSTSIVKVICLQVMCGVHCAGYPTFNSMCSKGGSLALVLQAHCHSPRAQSWLGIFQIQGTNRTCDLLYYKIWEIHLSTDNWSGLVPMFSMSLTSITLRHLKGTSDIFTGYSSH